MAKRKPTRRAEVLSKYHDRKERIVNYDNNDREAGKSAIMLLSVALGITSGVIGIYNSTHNKNAWPMLIPATGVVLCYGAMPRIDRHYDKKIEEEVEKLRNQYRIKKDEE